MRRGISAITILLQLIVVFTTVASELDLPLREHIKILTITPYGEATRGVFEDTLQDITYEAVKESVLEKIRTGFRPECDCDFDNAIRKDNINFPQAGPLRGKLHFCFIPRKRIYRKNVTPLKFLHDITN